MNFCSHTGLPGRRFRPCLESLEGRNCPSGFFAGSIVPSLMGSVPLAAARYASGASALVVAAPAADGENPTISLQAQCLDQNQVLITGQVECTSPGGLTITLSGVVSCTVVTDEDGSFSVGTSATSLGQIDASLRDREGLTGTGGTVLSNPSPTIDFGIVSEGFGLFTLQGTVHDTWAPGLEVIFSGVNHINGRSAFVREDGTFELTVQLDPNDAGIVTAHVANWWGDYVEQRDFVDGSN